MIKILVVDDEVDICDFVKDFFAARGFEVFAAHNGKAAIELVRKHLPEIILLDLKMPGMGGLEVLDEINKIDGFRKIIMITAVESVNNAEELKYKGVVNYITKPLSLEQVEENVMALAKMIESRA